MFDEQIGRMVVCDSTLFENATRTEINSKSSKREGNTSVQEKCYLCYEAIIGFKVSSRVNSSYFCTKCLLKLEANYERMLNESDCLDYSSLILLKVEYSITFPLPQSMNAADVFDLCEGEEKVNLNYLVEESNQELQFNIAENVNTSEHPVVEDCYGSLEDGHFVQGSTSTLRTEVVDHENDFPNSISIKSEEILTDPLQECSKNIDVNHKVVEHNILTFHIKKPQPPRSNKSESTLKRSKTLKNKYGTVSSRRSLRVDGLSPAQSNSLTNEPQIEVHKIKPEDHRVQASSGQDNSRTFQIKKPPPARSKNAPLGSKNVDKMSITCRICGRYFSDELKRHGHEREEHYDFVMNVYRCPKCDFSRPRMKDLIVHCKKYECTPRQYSPEGQLKHCRICKLSFRIPIKRWRHEIAVHQESKTKRFYCNKCNFSSKSIKHVMGHMHRVHEKSNVTTCRICSQQFATDLLRNIHEVETHLDSSTGMFSCKELQCNQQYIYKADYLRHLRRHFGKASSRSYECDICGNSFSKKDLLKCHLHIHKYSKELECYVCRKKYVNELELERHFQSHAISHIDGFRKLNVFHKNSFEGFVGI